MRVLRYHLSRALFELWTRIAPKDLIAEPLPACLHDPAGYFGDHMQRLEDRLLAAVQGRFIDDVWLPLGLERRLKAHLHRVNADATCAGWDQEDLFDVQEDIVAALLTAAKYGIDRLEQEDGVHYDEATGLSLERLPQEM